MLYISSPVQMIHRPISYTSHPNLNVKYALLEEIHQPDPNTNVLDPTTSTIPVHTEEKLFKQRLREVYSCGE